MIHIFTFRPLTRADFPLLGAWLERPHVAQWWRHDSEPAAVEADFGDVVDGRDPGEVFLALGDGAPIGLIQRYRFGDNPEWLAAFAMLQVAPESVGIDYFLADAALVGHGVGTAMIRSFLGETWQRHPDAPAIVVDVDQLNIASWRALEKLGFQRIWAGRIQSDHPSDEGPCFVLELKAPSRTSHLVQENPAGADPGHG